jgi:chromosome segregation ATPase
MVPKKLGDELWNNFLGACNKFFEARNAAGAGQRGEEYQNLEKKRGIIEQLKAIATETGDGLQEKVQQLVEQYQAIGHVPFKEKDKIYAEYHAIVDKLYKELNISVAKRRLSKFKDNLRQVAERGGDALDNERARLMRQYEQLKSEVQTYENNLGFLNASSKKGNSLIDEMNRKVQKLKDEVQLVRDKIKAIDAENREKE